MPAIAPHDSPTTDREWDGPAAVAAAPNDAGVLRYMHAWYAGANPDVKGSYRFPHHGPTRGSAAVLPGVRNALARVPQSNIPASEMEAVNRHLRGHLEE
jgi:hypothetical protein